MKFKLNDPVKVVDEHSRFNGKTGNVLEFYTDRSEPNTLYKISYDNSSNSGMFRESQLSLNGESIPNDDLVSLEILYENLTDEECKKLDVIVREVAAKHGVKVYTETRKSKHHS